MRRLRRPAVVPPTLADKGVRERDLLVTQPARRSKPASHWTEPDVRGALRAMQGWVCAYCLKDLADGDEVEHFRPKAQSLYWWLAYEFTNYFLACHGCNSPTNKGTRFPIEEGSARVVYETRDSLDAEGRLFADPSLDPVDDWFHVDLFRLDGLIKLEVRPQVVRGTVDRTRAQRTIDDLRLNLDPDVTQPRHRAFVEASKLHERNNILELRRRASRFQPQGLTYLAYLKDFLPEVSLPTSDEELSWFLADVNRKVTEYDRLCRDGQADRQSDRRFEEILWMLAAFWVDPPALDVSRIEAWLDGHGFIALVGPLRDRLLPSAMLPRDTRRP